MRVIDEDRGPERVMIAQHTPHLASQKIDDLRTGLDRQRYR